MYINIHTDWLGIINLETKKPYWANLEKKILNAYVQNVVYPLKENIFKCFNFFNFKEMKVIILGQDPYFKPNQANGLCFSVESNTSIPKSLNNIYKELKDDLGVKRTNGNLFDWAQQGVLLLNSILTVENNKSGSHKDFGWCEFTDNIIKYISDNSKNLVFLLWGEHAKSKIKLIDQNKHYIISSSHPSPLSAHNGFLGSKPFSKTNNFLKQHNKAIINW